MARHIYSKHPTLFRRFLRQRVADLLPINISRFSDTLGGLCTYIPFNIWIIFVTNYENVSYFHVLLSTCTDRVPCGTLGMLWHPQNTLWICAVICILSSMRAHAVTDSTIGITLFIPAINDHYGYLTFTLRLSLFFDSKTLRLSWHKSFFQFCVVPEHQYVI